MTTSISNFKEPIPNVKGPKLKPFPDDIEDMIFMRLLSSQEPYTSGSIPHGHVFKVRLRSKEYALKVVSRLSLGGYAHSAQFNFFSLGRIAPFYPGREHLLDKNHVRHHYDPFFAECRAFGKLIEEGKDDLLAVRCHGYVYLSESLEKRIEEKFGIWNWNRQVGFEGCPLRGILKDVIRLKSLFGQVRSPSSRKKKIADMERRLKQLNELRIFNKDIRECNYRDGRLFDFSLAITAPHIALSRKFQSEEMIEMDMLDDVRSFDSMIKKIQESEEAEQRTAQEKREKIRKDWVSRLRRR